MELEVVREVTPERLEGLTDLFEAVRAADHHEPLGEHKYLDLVHGGRAGFAGVIAHEDGGRFPIGYSQISRHENPVGAQWGLEVVVHPEHRGHDVEVRLVEEALRLVARAGGGHLHLWVFQPTETHDLLAQRLDLAKGRDLLHMRVDLPVGHRADLPPGVRIRAFRPGHDEQAWLDLNNRAFEHHPEQGSWERQTLARRMSEEWFDADDLLLAVDAAGLAGSNWTKLDHQRGVGEIYVIAVDPSRQGIGLGRSLAVAGLHHMHSRGMRTGVLYVDAANQAAVKMYRSLGFEVHHLDRAYVTDVPGD